jgi:DNA-binding transcriptional LysR family regulator
VELDALRAYLTAAEEGSLVRAARRLGVSRSALQRSITRLEAHLGARVLVRTPQGVALSGLGAFLAAPAADRLAQADALVEDVRAVGGPVG